MIRTCTEMSRSHGDIKVWVKVRPLLKMREGGKEGDCEVKYEYNDLFR